MINNRFLKNIFGTILLTSVLTTGCGEQKPQAAGPQALPVQLETLEETTLIDSSQFVGTLEATQRVSLAPRIQGRILRIFAPSGTQVAQGTPIVLLEPTQQQEEVNARKAEVESARADLLAAQSDLASAEADKAQAEANLQRAKADLERVQADLDLAQTDFKRAEFLIAEGVISQQELDNRTNALKTNQADVNAQIKTVAAQEQLLKAAEQGIARAQANIERNQANIAAAQAQVGVAQVNLEDNQVLAPIDGVVGDFPVKVGDFVSVGQELTTLTNNDEFNLRIYVPIERRTDLKLGLPVEIVDGGGIGEGMRGKITFISPNVDQNTQSILTKVTFANENGNLRDAQFIQVRIIWEERPGILVPTTAVSSLGSQKFIFVAQKDDNSQLVARQIPIQVGPIQGQAYQVVSGVKAGDQIAVSRILDLSDGRPIQAEQIQSQTN